MYHSDQVGQKNELSLCSPAKNIFGQSFVRRELRNLFCKLLQFRVLSLCFLFSYEKIQPLALYFTIWYYILRVTKMFIAFDPVILILAIYPSYKSARLTNSLNVQQYKNGQVNMDYFATTTNYKYGNYGSTWKIAQGIMLLEVTRIRTCTCNMIQPF